MYKTESFKAGSIHAMRDRINEFLGSNSNIEPVNVSSVLHVGGDFYAILLYKV